MSTFTKFNTLLFASAFALGSFAVATPANAQEYDIGSFEMVDLDGDGYVTDTEYNDYSYSMADYDSDGYLEEEEYTRYTETYYDPYDLSYDSFSAYDTDGDGYIEETEFSDVPTTDLYSAWDDNDDDQLDTNDWDQVTTYYDDYE